MKNVLAKGAIVISKDILGMMKRQVNFCTKKPVVSMLILTYRCNSRCRTCNNWKRPQEEEKKREINFDGWKFIIDELAEKGVRVVEVFGGNVLLRKDLLIDVLRHLKKKGMTVHLPTNNMGLDDEMADAIVKYVDYVYISLDGLEERQNFIRGRTGAFHNVENAVKKYMQFRGNCNVPRLICNTTVSRYNISQLSQIADYAEAMRFDEVHFEYVGEFTREHIEKSVIDGLIPAPYFMRGRESSLVNPEETRVLKENLKSIKRRSKGRTIKTVNIEMLSGQDLYRGTVPVKKCYVERTEVTVDPGGNIVICPFINNYVLGNLLQTPFERIWNNEKHKRFRKFQNSGAIEMCRHCILGVERSHSMLNSFKRIYLTRIEPRLTGWA